MYKQILFLVKFFAVLSSLNFYCFMLLIFCRSLLAFLFNFNNFLLIKSLDLVWSYVAQAVRVAHNIDQNFNVSSENFFPSQSSHWTWP